MKCLLPWEMATYPTLTMFTQPAEAVPTLLTRMNKIKREPETWGLGAVNYLKSQLLNFSRLLTKMKAI